MQGIAPEGPGAGGADHETASLAGTLDGDGEGDGDGEAGGDGDGTAAGRAKAKGKGWGGPVLLTPGRIQGMVNNLRGFQVGACRWGLGNLACGALVALCRLRGLTGLLSVHMAYHTACSNIGHRIFTENSRPRVPAPV